MLPPDLRGRLESPSAVRPPHRGIGGAAAENATHAAARARALGDPAPAPAGAEAEASAAETKAPALPGSCASCRRPLESEWNFCAKCGRDLVIDRDPVKWLGIAPFCDDDVQDYLFKGCIVRDLPILGTHKLRAKSSQPKDLKEVDTYFVNGEYKDKALSGELYKQLHTMATVATSVFSLDDKSVGKELKERMAWLEEQGSAFVDMITLRVAGFNRAWTKYLEAQNPILGS
jgi:hypothetical protein